MEEANEEFKQTERNQELKRHTPQGNIRRNYKENEYLGNVVHFVYGTSDIYRKLRKDKEFMSYVNIHK